MEPPCRASSWPWRMKEEPDVHDGHTYHLPRVGRWQALAIARQTLSVRSGPQYSFDIRKMLNVTQTQRNLPPQSSMQPESRLRCTFATLIPNRKDHILATHVTNFVCDSYYCHEGSAHLDSLYDTSIHNTAVYIPSAAACRPPGMPNRAPAACASAAAIWF